MKKKIIVRGPALSCSGYGEQTRFALRALRSKQEVFDIFLLNVGWGQTSWLWEDNEERRWIDSLISKTQVYLHQNSQPIFDISLQVTIPNEWERMAPVNIGYTAGIETTKVSPQWLEKTGVVDKIIVPSTHSKQVFERSAYKAQNKDTGEVTDLINRTPIEVISFPARDIKPVDIELDLKYDFNFLAISQWSPRKNIEKTVEWFVEEFIDQKVGLVLKLNIAKNCNIDKHYTLQKIKSLLSKENYKKRKCSVHVLHGYMTEEEMRGLYTHPKIKALISITHGEGFGLPLLEAAQSGLPIIATDWSSYLDFLYVEEARKGKKKKRPYFGRVDYDLKPVQKEAVWDGIIQEDALWAFPQQGSFKMKLRDFRKNYQRQVNTAKKLRASILEDLTEEKLYKKMAETIYGKELKSVSNPDYVFVSDFFADQIVGGAELTLDALIKNCDTDEHICINSPECTSGLLEKYKNSTWIFGNIANLEDEHIQGAIDNKLSYHFIEFDYKYCEYRNPVLYEFLEDEKCNYKDTEKSKLITNFINSSIQTHFMSQNQLDIYINDLPGINSDKTVVLSSVFNDEFFQKIEELNKKSSDKKEKWVVLGSRSWVKGLSQSEKWCKDHELDYEVVSGLTNEEMLEKLSEAKGICFKPTGLDTCPRFVIEAKLLGCELELNENVQHLKEKWFDTDDVEITLDYLKGRPEHFWASVQNA